MLKFENSARPLVHAYFSACWIQSDDYDIENSRQMFYKYWVSETIRKEEISGIPTIDFTYREENNNNLAGVYYRFIQS